MGLLNRSRRVGFLQATTSVLILTALAAPARSATNAVSLDNSSSEPARSWDATARRLMNSGRFAEASTIIERRLAADPKDSQARFLKGMLAIAAKDHKEAIRLFRSILIDEPDAGRVRLELARAFYLDKDYGNAMRQFQLALAADPPREVAANIDRYIASIRDAKSLSYNFGIALAPDTNLNTGSSAREVTLFGLPFDLSDEARERSGVGLALEGGGEWAPRIGSGKRLRLGLNAQRRDYSKSDFDDMTVAAYAGPRFVAGKWDVSLLGTAYKRWYSADPYNRAIGARAEATYYLTPRAAISGAFSAHSVKYRFVRERDGPLISLNGGAFYALTPSSGATLKGGVSRQNARLDSFSSWSGFVAAGYFKDLPMGFTGYVEPSFSVARYDEALLSFGRKRKDNTRSLLVTLLNRHLVLDRFTPRISYTYTRQKSSIALHRFDRSRFELGFTTEF